GEPSNRQEPPNDRREREAPRVVAGCEPHVGDALVRGVLRVDREVEGPFQLLVDTDVAERRAPRERTAKSLLEPGHRHPALSTIWGSRLEIDPRRTASPSSSISVGLALWITTRAPARLATGTTPAIGYTDSFVPTASIRS